MTATPKLDNPLEGGSSPVLCSRSSIVDFIRRYNRWRRGDESLTMESPKAIGEALDAVCGMLDQHANEIKGWQNKWECAVEMAARAEVERDIWKANHDNQVEIKRIIAARPDLKERAPMVEKLVAERNRAQAHSIRQHERIKQLESVPTKELLANLLELAKSKAFFEHEAAFAKSQSPSNA